MKKWQAVRLLFQVGDGTFVDEKRLYVRQFGLPCDVEPKHKFVRTLQRYGVYETVAVVDDPDTAPPPHDEKYYAVDFKIHYLKRKR
jgi:hypothetical protein